MDIAISLIKHPTEQKILIAQRKPDVPLANLWEFPGGKCRPGESLQEAALRETEEEVGLSVQVLEAWPAIVHSYSTHAVRLYPFVCLAFSADARPLDNQQVVWVASSDLDRYEFPAANRPLLESIKASGIF